MKPDLRLGFSMKGDTRFGFKADCPTTMFYGGCLKMSKCKASEIPRNEAYETVRRSDEG